MWESDTCDPWKPPLGCSVSNSPSIITNFPERATQNGHCLMGIRINGWWGKMNFQRNLKGGVWLKNTADQSLLIKKGQSLPRLALCLGSAPTDGAIVRGAPTAGARSLPPGASRPSPRVPTHLLSPPSLFPFGEKTHRTPNLEAAMCCPVRTVVTLASERAPTP